MMRSSLVVYLTVVMAWAGCGSAHALWARLSVEELVGRSDLIVIGTYEGVAREQAGGQLGNLGSIRVTSVLKGPPELKRALIALPPPEAPISSTDLSYRVGQDGLWFLRRKMGRQTDVYVADHPQRFVPSNQAEVMVEEVRRNLDGVRSPGP